MNKRLTLLLALPLAAYIGAALAQTTVLSPVTTSITASGTATLAALPSNPSRRQVIICNGSATATATFTTGSVTPVSLTTGVVLQTGNVASSCFTMGSGASPGLSVGNSINVIASTGGVPITFVEFF
jgi:hypothetical protein